MSVRKKCSISFDKIALYQLPMSILQWTFSQMKAQRHNLLGPYLFGDIMTNICTDEQL